MAERKVLTKYYPPDFDPSKIVRSRVPKTPGPKVIPVRLMAPFSMKCTSCGEYIYKGRKFNARKETTEEKYYAISIYRFYIRCTRCSAEITFKTDPKNMDYAAEKGAKRNFEPWREKNGVEESEEERLDRLEREEEEKNAMLELETKTLDAKREMAIADALDEIRTRNARIERGEGGVGVATVRDEKDEERERAEREDEETARRAFMRARTLESIEVVDDEGDDVPDIAAKDQNTSTSSKPPPSRTPEVLKPQDTPTFKRVVKKKKDFSAALGIKKAPRLV
jgi:uncharacterized protein YnzC (UPF0291/DUF896 family)